MILKNSMIILIILLRHPVEITLSIKADYYEDMERIKTFLHAPDYLRIIEEAQLEIRSRIKYTEITDEEGKFLCRLQDTLFIEE